MSRNENNDQQNVNTDAMLTPAEVETYLSNLGAIVSAITNPSSSAHKVLEGVVIIRRLLSVNKRPPIAGPFAFACWLLQPQGFLIYFRVYVAGMIIPTEVVATGAASSLVKILLSQEVSDKLRFESLWALTNIASGTSEQCRALIEAGALPAFVQMAKSSSSECREQAVWAIGNIAGDSEDLRDMALKAGCMQAVMRLINPGNPAPVAMLRNVAWTLSNMCRGKKPLPPFEYVRNALPALSWLLNYDDTEVIQDSAWGLSYISDEPGDQNQKLDVFVSQNGLVQRLIWLMDNYQKQKIVVTPVLRAIGNVLTGSDRQTDCVLQGGAVEVLLKLLRHPQKNVRKESAWALSNITAGQPHQIQHVVGNGELVEELCKLLRGGDVVVQREAAWTIANACSCGNDEQLTAICRSQDVAEALSDALKCGDKSIIKVVCEAFVALLKFEEKIYSGSFAELLEESGGLDSLEELQHHSSDEIYRAVSGVFQQLQKSGSAEVEEEVSMAEDGQTFNFGSTSTFATTNDFNPSAQSSWNF